VDNYSKCDSAFLLVNHDPLIDPLIIQNKKYVFDPIIIVKNHRKKTHEKTSEKIQKTSEKKHGKNHGEKTTGKNLRKLRI
jgi:hypothetical protein